MPAQRPPTTQPPNFRRLAIIAAAALALALLIIAAVWLHALFNALADLSPDLENPNHFQSQTLAFQYPGNWWIDTSDPLYDGLTYLEVNAPQDAALQIALADGPADPRQILTHETQLMKANLGLIEQQTFTRWGPHTGQGIQLAGWNQGAHIVARLFVFSAAPDRHVILREYHSPDIHPHVLQGLALIQRTLHVQPPSAPPPQ